MNWINLTPHTINVLDESGNAVENFAPSGAVARCKQEVNFVANVGGVDTYVSTFGAVYDLPEQVLGTNLIVSGLVRAAVNREDCYQPGRLVRDGKGVPVGCVGLSQ